jgi:SAM-dependent methyltransferase
MLRDRTVLVDLGPETALDRTQSTVPARSIGEFYAAVAAQPYNLRVHGNLSSCGPRSRPVTRRGSNLGRVALSAMTVTSVFRWDVVNELLSTTNQKRYLEIGVQRGKCAAKVNASEKWGVDPEPLGGAQRSFHQLFKQTSDDFFARVSPGRKFDVIFVDGLHHADQVLRDVENALRHLAEGGFIVMHDCNPQSEEAQRVPRMCGVWNGDCWKAMVELRKRPDLVAFTIDSDHGVGVVRRGRNPDPLVGPPPMADLTYGSLERNRVRFLGLVSPKRWEEHIEPLGLGRVVIVSAILGGRDEPVKLPELDADECVLFTDGAGAAGWTVVKQAASGDPRRAARKIKTLALDIVQGDIVVWIDGRIAPTGAKLRPMLRRALRSSTIASYPHPWRQCLYDEARECAALRLAPEVELKTQAAEYSAAGFPRRAGLWNTMVVARRRTEAMVEFGRDWWAQLQKHTLRDQVSFPYVLWQSGLSCSPLGADVYAPGSSVHFVRGQHRRGDVITPV